MIVARRLDVMDHPDTFVKPHARATPYLGGTAIAAGWIAACATALALSRAQASELLPWLVGAAATAYIAGNRCKREALGAVLGGVVGGVAGSELGKREHREAATIAGALIGVLVGQSIGRSLDRADQYCTGQTLEYADDREAVEWRDPDSDTRYRVTPTATYEARDGRYCREYTSQATIGGQQQQTYGTACRQPDGAWEVVNLAPRRESQAF